MEKIILTDNPQGYLNVYYKIKMARAKEKRPKKVK
jgi:hypothetical protein